MSKNRVVVSGLGLVTSVGLDLDTSWANLKAGVSGAKTITRFSTEKNYTKFGCLLSPHFEEEVRKYAPRRLLRQTTATCQASFLAAHQMMRQYGIDYSGLDRTRIAVIIGTGGALDLGSDFETEASNQYVIVKNMPNAVPARISMEWLLEGPSFTVSTACASGADAIGVAYTLIKAGVVDAVVTGGTDAVVNTYTIRGFNAVMALSERNDSPETASRPFDANRTGFVIGEGAGVLLLESEDHARRRGAKIICEHLGYASTCEASDIMRPKDGGVGMAHTMALALKNAGVRPEEVDYISAHGTSTPQNDRSETMAIKEVLGAQAKKVAVSSQKSMIGHSLGASGAIEFVVSAKIIEEGFLTPTINYETPDTDMDLDYVPNVGRKADVRVVLSNSFGFGGHNCTHVLGRYEP